MRATTKGLIKEFVLQITGGVHSIMSFIITTILIVGDQWHLAFAHDMATF